MLFPGNLGFFLFLREFFGESTQNYFSYWKEMERYTLLYSLTAWLNLSFSFFSLSFSLSVQTCKALFSFFKTSTIILTSIKKSQISIKHLFNWQTHSKKLRLNLRSYRVLASEKKCFLKLLMLTFAMLSTW